MKYIKYLLLVMLMTVAIPGIASEEKSSAQFSPKELVLEHIGDSYNWHITDIGKKSITIPLPVIVKTSTGWHTFMSSQFSNEVDKNGYIQGPYNLVIPTKGEYDGKIVEVVSGKEVHPLDLSITKTVAVLFINAIILLFVILVPARWYKNRKPSDPAPKGFTGFVEMFIMYVVDEIIKPGVGKGYEKYAPYLLTCFFFIFICNIMGVVPFPPGGGNVTGNITVTFFLAICTFVITQFSGTKHYWKDIFWGDVPVLLKVPIPIIPIIEFVGIFTKPFALMIRLFANMMAGHAIAVALTCIIFVVASKAIGVFVGMTTLSVLMSVFMMCLECLVCFIQAMVFTMLSAVFIGLARMNEE